MFLFDLTYEKPLSQVDSLLPRHIAYLERRYQSGHFLCSGRKVPRTGGVILCRASTPEEAQAILEEDPFYTEGIASYRVTEFLPSKCAAGLAPFLENP